MGIRKRLGLGPRLLRQNVTESNVQEWIITKSLALGKENLKTRSLDLRKSLRHVLPTLPNLTQAQPEPTLLLLLWLMTDALVINIKINIKMKTIGKNPEPEFY